MLETTQATFLGKGPASGEDFNRMTWPVLERRIQS